jgi:hypothetical protein
MVIITTNPLRPEAYAGGTSLNKVISVSYYTTVGDGKLLEKKLGGCLIQSVWKIAKPCLAKLLLFQWVITS